MLEKIIKKINSINLKVVAFVLGVAIGFAIGVYQPPPHEYNYEEIIIEPGDTLWDLTRKKSSNDIHIQELINATNTANGIKGDLVPGQHIKLAISVKED